MARGHLPGNDWLSQPLLMITNLSFFCNAGYGGDLLVTSLSNDVCANTGEIPAIVDHELGHGLDEHDATADFSFPAEGIADLYAARGEASRAEPLFERTLQIQEQVLGAGHPNVAVSLNNLAELYRGTGADGGTLYCIPISGYGLWSTLYGFLALEADLDTVRGITFYEHKETPGLGGEVDNPSWQAQWKGKKILDASGATSTV